MTIDDDISEIHWMLKCLLDEFPNAKKKYDEDMIRVTAARLRSAGIPEIKIELKTIGPKKD